MGQQTTRAGELRSAIDELPLGTRRAMLDGIDVEPIVVGADGDPRGGVCPMYAMPTPPSKRVGRPFARAWDRYARARLPRRANEHEVRALRSMLESSIEGELEPSAAPDPPALSLRAAIAAHRALQARSRAAASPAAETGGTDRTAELSGVEGWAWLRPFRRYDDYERALDSISRAVRPPVPRRIPMADDELIGGHRGSGLRVSRI